MAELGPFSHSHQTLFEVPCKFSDNMQKSADIAGSGDTVHFYTLARGTAIRPYSK